MLASPPSEPKIITNSLRADTSNELANKTSEDFYSKLSSIDQDASLVNMTSEMMMNSSNLP